jgi:hypothetical protein
MEKVDYKKVYKEFYSPPKKPVVVDVPKFNFILVDGKGDPNTSAEYREAMEALYGMAYTLKFTLKLAGRTDFTVMPLEGLWWVGDMGRFEMSSKGDWSWTAMIMQPDVVSKQDAEDAMKQLKERKNPIALPRLRFGPYHEGLSVQVMYLGPYSDEGPTIEAMHRFAEEQGYSLRGKHHEIYLGDPRRTAPEKLKTVIRQPVR